MRLLIVEDDAELAHDGFGICRSAPCAASGQHRRRCRASDPAINYAAIILDLGLPDENGLALLRRLRGYKRMEPILAC